MGDWRTGASGQYFAGRRCHRDDFWHGSVGALGTFSQTGNCFSQRFYGQNGFSGLLHCSLDYRIDSGDEPKTFDRRICPLYPGHFAWRCRQFGRRGASGLLDRLWLEGSGSLYRRADHGWRHGRWCGADVEDLRWLDGDGPCQNVVDDDSGRGARQCDVDYRRRSV